MINTLHECVSANENPCKYYSYSLLWGPSACSADICTVFMIPDFHLQLLNPDPLSNCYPWYLSHNNVTPAILKTTMIVITTIKTGLNIYWVSTMISVFFTLGCHSVWALCNTESSFLWGWSAWDIQWPSKEHFKMECLLSKKFTQETPERKLQFFVLWENLQLSFFKIKPKLFLLCHRVSSLARVHFIKCNILLLRILVNVSTYLWNAIRGSNIESQFISA